MNILIVLAEADLSPVVSAVDGVSVAVVSVCAVVVGGAMTLFAVKFAGGWLLTLWQSFTDGDGGVSEPLEHEVEEEKEWLAWRREEDSGDHN